MRKFTGFILMLMAAWLMSGPSRAREPVDYVNPYIGTHGPPGPSLYGGMIPSAARPFAMIQWTPMTRHNKIGVCPYRYHDKSIMGFMGTRQPAVWMGDYGYVSLMPGVGRVRHGYEERKARFSHDDEETTPYYYSVSAGEVRTEMTGASRAAIFRITYPRTGSPWVVIDASRDPGFAGSVVVEPEKNRIVGYNSDRHSAHLGPALPNFKGWFVVEFDRPFFKFGTYNGKERHPDRQTETGERIGAYVEFQDNKRRALKVRVGTSLISLEQAEDNLRREIEDWDFDKVKAATKKAWNDQLSRIEVEGPDDDMKTIFYTAMYHSHLYPRIFSEDGRYYSAFDDQVHEGVSYNDYSLWDTFRAEHPLLILTAPERVGDMVTGLVQMYEEGGWLPKWPNPSYTGIMIGSHADSMIADAWVKGIRNFDLEQAYEAVYKDATVPPDGDEHKRWKNRAPWTSVESRAGLYWYLKLGYVPVDKTNESVSRTLEFAYDDFCAAQLAKALGKHEDYEMLMDHSQNYRNLYHDGYMQARRADGSWAGKKGYTESIKWGYMFFAIQDVPGLVEIMGGDQAFEKKLDKVFTPGPRLYRYMHPNEPVHHYAYLYDYCNAPWKTQKETRYAAEKYYKNKPSGLYGNDDCGQMSAWYIFSTLGFYPVTPGSDIYAIGSPHWERATINIDKPYPESAFTIISKNQGPENIYIQSATLNGKPLNQPFIKHGQITAGGELVFVMGPEPNKNWGVK